MSTNLFIIYTTKKVCAKNRIFQRFLPYMLSTCACALLFTVLKKRTTTLDCYFSETVKIESIEIESSHLDCPRYTLKTRSRWPPVAKRVRSLRGDCEEFKKKQIKRECHILDAKIYIDYVYILKSVKQNDESHHSSIQFLFLGNLERNHHC